MHELRRDRHSRQDLERKRRTTNEPRVGGQRLGALEERVARPDPREQAADEKEHEGVRCARIAGTRTEKETEDRCKDGQQEQRVRQRPEKAECATAVAGLELPTGQRDEEAAVAQHGSEGLHGLVSRIVVARSSVVLSRQTVATLT